MAVYLVVHDLITDPEEFGQYTQAIKTIIQDRGGRMIVATPDIGEREQTVVFECLSREDALGFWNSEQCATVREMQKSAVPFQALIIEGFIQL